MHKFTEQTLSAISINRPRDVEKIYGQKKKIKNNRSKIQQSSTTTTAFNFWATGLVFQSYSGLARSPLQITATGFLQAVCLPFCCPTKTSRVLNATQSIETNLGKTYPLVLIVD